MSEQPEDAPEPEPDVEMLYVASGSHALSCFEDPDGGSRQWMCACGGLVLDDRPSPQLMDAFFEHVDSARNG